MKLSRLFNPFLFSLSNFVFLHIVFNKNSSEIKLDVDIREKALNLTHGMITYNNAPKHPLSLQHISVIT